jgi:hypothetical protein
VGDIVERLRKWEDRHGNVTPGELMDEAAAEIARLREERRWVPVLGEIVDMEFSREIGVYFGTIRCPKCDQEVSVSPMADRPKCRCGVQWDFSVSAVGEQPLPPGPEVDG